VNYSAVFNAPRDWKPSRDGECAALPAVIVQESGAQYLRSYWKPSAEELCALHQGQVITLDIMGLKHPIVRVGVDQVEEMPIPKEILGG
jgi:hypothetical protein